MPGCELQPNGGGLLFVEGPVACCWDDVGSVLFPQSYFSRIESHAHLPLGYDPPLALTRWPADFLLGFVFRCELGF
jgi:hypothetical protein